MPSVRYVGGGGTCYDVVGPAWTDDRHELLRAYKRYPNFRYPAQQLDETRDDESLQVLIRVPRLGTEKEGPGLPFELGSVLALPWAPWFLEAIDVIDPPQGHPERPSLVMADPHVEPDFEGTGGERVAGSIVRTACEALGMVEALNDAGLVLGAMSAGDFLIDRDGRWFYLGSDRVRAAAGGEEFREDLVHWARLVDGWLGGTASLAVRCPWPSTTALTGEERDLTLWLFDRVSRCLATDERLRPQTVEELRRGKARVGRLLPMILRPFRGGREGSEGSPTQR